MIDLIKSIPGPYFLLIYLVYAAGIIFLFKRTIDNDDTGSIPTPEPTLFCTTELALLMGGLRRAITAALAKMKNYNIISVEQDGKNFKYNILNKNINQLDPFERNVYYILKDDNKANLYDTKNFNKLTEAIKPYEESLLKNNLLASKEQKNRSKNIKFMGFLVMAWLPIIKLYLGIANSKPIVFLVILFLVTIIVYFVVLKSKNVSNLGSRLIESAQQRFTYVRNQSSQENLDTDVLNYAVAVFGIYSLTSLSTNDYVFGTNTTNDTSTTGCSGSSCSSSCSGSSCSGSSCSSGCGGCGGGD